MVRRPPSPAAANVLRLFIFGQPFNVLVQQLGVFQQVAGSSMSVRRELLPSWRHRGNFDEKFSEQNQHAMGILWR